MFQEHEDGRGMIWSEENGGEANGGGVSEIKSCGPQGPDQHRTKHISCSFNLHMQLDTIAFPEGGTCT